ncbi:dTDP-4-dehydrorhamnose reductase [Kamptonema cortianum]|nr:dTDP-4-dehydrorhamnose reductase [Geitlerinema splendidum]MDK3156141.1 dTDP-4-dehydrorhamnose reductase [Kamptonema cortianum]
MPETGDLDKQVATTPQDSSESSHLRILLIGSSGMLGRDLLPALLEAGHHVRNPFREDLDILNMEHLEGIRKGDWGQIDVIINCAAYTAVDQAETDTMSAMRLNAVAAGGLAVIAMQIGARVLHISTDFVFDGKSSTPYIESAQTLPLNVYGKSKLLGEQNVLKECPPSWVIRTSWLYGAHGKCFPRTMIEAWREGKELRVVNDQIGCPTYTVELAKSIVEFLAVFPRPGIYHVCGPESMSWYDFAKLTLECAQASSGSSQPIRLSPVTTAEFPTPAARPKYSVLDTSRVSALGVRSMAPVKDSLVEFCTAFTQSSKRNK